VQLSGDEAVVDIKIHFPVSEEVFFPYVWGVARLAPHFRVDDTSSREALAVAHFPDCSDSADHVDLALHLMEESTRVPRAWVSINGRSLSSLRGVRERLRCYRASLGVPNRELYCDLKMKEQAALVGCHDYGCARSCQFVCDSCVRTVPVVGRPLKEPAFGLRAAMAEIDWCPGLKAMVRR